MQKINPNERQDIPDNFDLEQRITVLETLLRACYNYVERHWKDSHAGTGYAAKELIDAINKVLRE